MDFEEDKYRDVEYSISEDEGKSVIEELFYDCVYLRYLLDEERDADVVNYVEEKFPDESNSQGHQIELMRTFPFFGNKILDNEEISNNEKQRIFFRNLMESDNKEGRIVLVDGAMGGGKTGFGCWALDLYHNTKPYLKYFFVTKSTHPPTLPKWIKIIKSIDDVQNDSIVLVDEGAIQLGSRNSFHQENKNASDLLVQLRQRGITMILVVQNILMIDVNVRRLATIRILKYGISFGVERKRESQRVNKDLELIRNRLKPKSKDQAYMEITSESIYFKFSHQLPVWWNKETTSKYMKNWDLKKERKEKIEAIKKAGEEEQKKQLDFYKQKVEIQAEAYTKRGLPPPKVRQKTQEDFEKEELLG